MSDDFIKQLQENAVDKATYESQKQEAEKNERENARLGLYRNVIERTKEACVEAVKTGAFSTDDNRKKVCGTLEFFCGLNSDIFSYEELLGVNIIIQDRIMAQFYPKKVGWLSGHISDETIVFIIHEMQKVDVSSFIDKLFNEKRTEIYYNYKDDEKEIQNFISLFQSKIANSRIISYSKIDFHEFRHHNFTHRKFDFEIVF